MRGRVGRWELPRRGRRSRRWWCFDTRRLVRREAALRDLDACLRGFGFAFDFDFLLDFFAGFRAAGFLEAGLAAGWREAALDSLTPDEAGIRSHHLCAWLATASAFNASCRTVSPFRDRHLCTKSESGR